ncbi:MAG: hypothetical protein PWR24_1657 [Desulfonauticus sp.]|nr:hypothetical protein [Desulfonauticus sp.]
MPLNPGDIILVFKKYLNGIDHDKFAICVAPEYFFFFYINSKPWNKAPDAQVQVMGKLEISCLTHTSYIDTSSIQQLPKQAIDAAIQAGKVWSASPNVCQRIKEVVKNSRYLSLKHKKIILNSL